MTDIVFDIDGTLADCSHRIHWIKNPASWGDSHSPPRPNWERFLSDEEIVKDTPIQETFELLSMYLWLRRRVIFITGRRVSQELITRNWLGWGMFGEASERIDNQTFLRLKEAPIYMRAENDYRSSDATKRDALHRARADGYNPTIAYEDRDQDAKMWRDEGLRCFQVANGDY